MEIRRNSPGFHADFNPGPRRAGAFGPIGAAHPAAADPSDSGSGSARVARLSWPTEFGPPPHGHVHVLAVCTANVCRSRATAHLLFQRLSAVGFDDDALEVRSAGTEAATGSAMCVASRRWTEGRIGLLPDAEAGARQVDARLIEWADLVVTMTREQRAAVVRVWPKARARTFTLAEAATYARWVATGDGVREDEPANGLRALVAEMDAARGLAPRPVWPASLAVTPAPRRRWAALSSGPLTDPGDAADIPDPHDTPTEVHEPVMSLLDTWTAMLAHALEATVPQLAAPAWRIS